MPLSHQHWKILRGLLVVGLLTLPIGPIAESRVLPLAAPDQAPLPATTIASAAIIPRLSTPAAEAVAALTQTALPPAASATPGLPPSPTSTTPSATSSAPSATAAPAITAPATATAPPAAPSTPVPPAPAAGGGQESEITRDIALNGESLAFENIRAGQPVRLVHNGTAGQVVTLRIAAGSTIQGPLKLVGPDDVVQHLGEIDSRHGTTDIGPVRMTANGYSVFVLTNAAAGSRATFSLVSPTDSR